jgi:hypothetical protein
MNEIQKSYGQWIESLAEWDWFATFTFEYPTSPRTANRLWRQWLHTLEREVNGQVHFIRVQEEDGDRVHYHCLLAGVRDQKPSVWERAWHNIAGIAQITPYISDGGGAHYIGKKACQECQVAFSKHIEKVTLYA